MPLYLYTRANPAFVPPKSLPFAAMAIIVPSAFNESDEADPKTQELLSTGTPEALPPIGTPYALSGGVYETIIFVSFFQKSNLWFKMRSRMTFRSKY